MKAGGPCGGRERLHGAGVFSFPPESRPNLSADAPAPTGVCEAAVSHTADPGPCRRAACAEARRVQGARQACPLHMPLGASWGRLRR